MVVELSTGEKLVYLVDDYAAELDVSVGAKLVDLILQ